MNSEKEFEILGKVAGERFELSLPRLRLSVLPLDEPATDYDAGDGGRTRKATSATHLTGGRVYHFHHTGIISGVEARGFAPLKMDLKSIGILFTYAPTKRRLTQSCEASFRKIHLLLPMFLNNFRLLLSVPHTEFRFFADAPYAGNFSSISLPCKGSPNSFSIRVVASAIDRRPAFSNGFLLLLSSGISNCRTNLSCCMTSFPVSNSYNFLYNTNRSLVAAKRGSNLSRIFSFSWIFLSKDSAHSFTCITPYRLLLIYSIVPLYSIGNIAQVNRYMA